MLHAVCRRYTLTQDELPPVLACPRAKAVFNAHWGCVRWVNRTTITSHCLLFLIYKQATSVIHALSIFVSVQLSSSLLTTVIRPLCFHPRPAADSPLEKSCSKGLQKGATAHFLPETWNTASAAFAVRICLWFWVAAGIQLHNAKLMPKETADLSNYWTHVQQGWIWGREIYAICVVYFYFFTPEYPERCF